jgi:hypothetical protein
VGRGRRGRGRERRREGGEGWGGSARQHLSVVNIYIWRDISQNIKKFVPFCWAVFSSVRDRIIVICNSKYSTNMAP